MNPRTTAVLGLLALVLGAFVYFYEIQGGERRESEVEKSKRLFAKLEADAIDSLAFTTSDGQPARFERREGAWRVVAPVESKGDATALDAVAGALAQLARAGGVDSAGGDVAQFGLGPDAREVAFAAADARHRLRIGRATPVGGNVYVQADDAKEVVFVESYRLNALNRSLADLRDRRIASIDPEALRTLALAWPENGATVMVELARDGSGPWKMVKPVAGRADQQTVRELLSNLEFLQASGFVDDRGAAVETALGETALELRWTSAGDAAPDAAASADGALRIAGLLDGSRVVESADRLLSLAPERLEDFTRSVEAYRDRQLFELAPESLRGIELEFADGGRVSLAREGEGWTAKDVDVESDAVSSLAESLGTLRAEAILADEMGPAELERVGLAPPAVRIRLERAAEGAAETSAAATEGGSKGALVLELGRLDPDRGLVAKRGDETVVYALAASLAEALPLDRSAFDARFGKSAEPR